MLLKAAQGVNAPRVTVFRQGGDAKAFFFGKKNRKASGRLRPAA
jgi:hypothetical protein